MCWGVMVFLERLSVGVASLLSFFCVVFCLGVSGLGVWVCGCGCVECVGLAGHICI